MENIGRHGPNWIQHVRTTTIINQMSANCTNASVTIVLHTIGTSFTHDRHVFSMQLYWCETNQVIPSYD